MPAYPSLSDEVFVALDRSFRAYAAGRAEWDEVKESLETAVEWLADQPSRAQLAGEHRLLDLLARAERYAVTIVQTTQVTKGTATKAATRRALAHAAALRFERAQTALTALFSGRVRSVVLD